MMREMTMDEIASVCGGDFTESFNACMAENWWENTVTGAIGGAVGGALFAGGGAFVGFLGGGVGGSTGTFGYCLIQAL